MPRLAGPLAARLGPVQRAGSTAYRRFGGLNDRHHPLALNRLDSPECLNVRFGERVVKGRGGWTKVSPRLKDGSLSFFSNGLGYATIPDSAGHWADLGAGQAFYLGIGACLRNQPAGSVTVVNKGYGAGANIQYRLSYEGAVGGGSWRLLVYDPTAAALRTYDIADNNPVGRFRYFEALQRTAALGNVVFRFTDELGNVTTSGTTTALTGLVNSAEVATLGVSESAAATIGTDFFDGDVWGYRWKVASNNLTLYAASASNKYYLREPFYPAVFDGHYALDDATHDGLLTDRSGAAVHGQVQSAAAKWTADKARTAGPGGLEFTGTASRLHVVDKSTILASAFNGTSNAWILTLLYSPPVGSALVNRLILWTGNDAANPLPLGLYIDGAGNIRARHRDSAGNNVEAFAASKTMTQMAGKRIRIVVTRQGTAAPLGLKLRCWFEDATQPNGWSYEQATSAVAVNASAAASTKLYVGRHVTTADFPYAFSTAIGSPLLGAVSDLQLFKQGVFGFGGADPASYQNPFGTELSPALAGQATAVLKLTFAEGYGNQLRNGGTGGASVTTTLRPSEFTGWGWGVGYMEPYYPPTAHGIFKFDRLDANGATKRNALVVSGGSLQSVDYAAGTVAPLAGGFLKGGEQWTAAQYRQRLLLAARSGGQPRWTDGSVVRPLGIRRSFDPPNTTLNGAGGTIAVGSYYVYVSYYRESPLSPDGAAAESQASDGFLLVNAAVNNKIDRIRLPVSPDPQVTARRIYIGAAGAAEYSTAYLALTILDNVTTDTTGLAAYEITAIPNSGVTAVFSGQEEAPAGGPVQVFGDTVFLGGTPEFATRVFYSTAGVPDYWRATGQYVDADQDAGDPVTALWRTRNRLFVDLRDGRGELFFTGDTTLPWIVQRVETNYAAAGPLCVCPLNDAQFLVISEQDVWITDGNDSHPIASPETDQEAPGIDYSTNTEWNRATVKSASCAFHRKNNEAWVCVQLTTGEKRVYVYDTVQKNWTVFDFPCDVIAVLEDANDDPQVYGVIDGYLCKLDVDGTGDGGTAALKTVVVVGTGAVEGVVFTVGSTTGATDDAYRGCRLHYWNTVTGVVTALRIVSSSGTGLVCEGHAAPAVGNAADRIWLASAKYYLDQAWDFGEPFVRKRASWLRLICDPTGTLFQCASWLRDFHGRRVATATAFQQTVGIAYAGAHLALLRLGGHFSTMRLRLYGTDVDPSSTSVVVLPAYPLPCTAPPTWTQIDLEAVAMPKLLQ